MAEVAESPKLTKRQEVVRRWSALKTERTSWDSHWRDLSQYILPRTGRFFVEDRNRGDRRNQHILDSTGTQALKVARAGMMAGASSPARPWFRLNPADPDMGRYHPVRVWLDDVAERMRLVFNRSNTYRALDQVYGELLLYGTAVSIVLPDFRNIIHHYPLTAGEYCIQQDFQGRVVTMYREFERTAAEVVKEFGYDRCSTRTQQLVSNGKNLDAPIKLIHAIEPRADRNPQLRDNQNMPWRSCTFEHGGEEGKILRESGFERFPCLVPRWSTVGGDVYGSSPGMEALGDIKGLQHLQFRKAESVDQELDPALQMPLSLANRDVEAFPGGRTFVDQNSPHGGVRRMWESNLPIQWLLEDIRDHRQRIQSAFHADLFLMLANSVDQGKTATEVAQLVEEKMVVLGPVLEGLHNELLEPLVDMTFARMLEAGVLPPPPPELQGMTLDVEFVSMLAQAQRAIGTNSVDRWLTVVGAVGQADITAWDVVEVDETLRDYADRMGVSPTNLRDPEKVLELRQSRAAAAAAQEQAAALETTSKAAKNFAQTPTEGDNALTGITQQFSGYTG